MHTLYQATHAWLRGRSTLTHFKKKSTQKGSRQCMIHVEFLFPLIPLANYNQDKHYVETSVCPQRGLRQASAHFCADLQQSDRQRHISQEKERPAVPWRECKAAAKRHVVFAT